MKFLRRTCLVFAALLLASAPQAQASESGSVYAYNQEISAQWVNWRPENWERSEAVQSLAGQLFAEAGSREAVPQHIHRWICTNMAYDWEALENEAYSALLPSQVLRERRAVCEGIANLVQALFLEAGIPCIKVWGAALAADMDWEESSVDSSHVNHTWNEFYMDGRWITLDCTMDILGGGTAYFDPPEAFFAQTHKRLYRGDPSPENIPSAWAVPAITDAVDAGWISLEWLANYRHAVSEAEWFALTGLGENRDVVLTRAAAAVSLAPQLARSNTAAAPYCDLALCTANEKQCIALLFGSGIMTGWNRWFFPKEPLTRQAAIAVWARLHRMEETGCT